MKHQPHYQQQNHSNDINARCYASAAYAVMRCLSVRPSVCLSRSWILSKRINMFTKFVHRRIAKPFYTVFKKSC